MNGDKGFTYPAALLMIVVVSSSLMVAQKQWSTVMKREREAELFFRAGQIIQAIDSYYQNSPGQTRQYPRSFKVLLKDNRFPVVKRHLRKAYKDPFTGEDFGLDGHVRICFAVPEDQLKEAFRRIREVL